MHCESWPNAMPPLQAICIHDLEITCTPFDHCLLKCAHHFNCPGVFSTSVNKSTFLKRSQVHFCGH